MYQTGYLATRRRNPASLATVIALHGAVLTALMLYRTDVVEFVDRGIPLIKIAPEVTHIPPEVRPPVTNRDPHPSKMNPQPPIDTSTQTGGEVTGFTLPPVDTLGPVGSGAGPIEIPADPPIKVEPVYVGAGLGPNFAQKAQPPYPAGMQRAEIEGSVTVRVQIDIDGRVIAVEQVSADQPEFFTATRDWATRNWRFKPATRDGVPVTSWRTMTVHFQMQR